MADAKKTEDKTIKSKMLLLILIAGVFGLLAVFLKFGSDQNIPSNLNLNKSNINNIINIKNINSSVDVDSCGNLSGIEKVKCYLYEGNLDASIKVCGNLSGIIREECFGRVSFSAAEEDEDISIKLCGEIGGGSSGEISCFSGIAGIIANNNITKAENLCQNITGTASSVCYANIARTVSYRNYSRALEICEKIQSPDCYRSVADAAAKKDVYLAENICSKISDQYQNIFCYMSVAKYAALTNITMAFDVCSKTDERCFIDVGALAGSSSPSDAEKACERINNTEFKQLCYSKIGPEIAKADFGRALSMCGKSGDSISNSVCRTKVAVNIAPENLKESLEICKSTGDMCYSEVSFVIDRKNTTQLNAVCGTIKDEFFKKLCYGQ